MSNQKTAINGAKWTTSATVITTILNAAQTAIIARILAPSVFGLVSICTIMLSFFQVFANLGFANSIISTQETDKKKLSTIFFSSAGLGVIFCIVINLCSPLVVSFYHEPKLAAIIPLAALNFPLIYSGQIYNTLLQKELRFKTIAVNDTLCVVASIVTTVTLAYNGFNEFAMMYGQLTWAGVRLISYTLTGIKLFRPVWHFKPKEIQDHLKFGIYSIGEGLLGFANSNLENILIGRLISLEALGYYNIAWTLAIFPIYKLNPIIMQVSFPIMAKMKDNEGLKRAYLKIVDFITYCNFPILTGLALTALGVVPLVFGHNFLPSVPLFKVVVFVGFLSCVTTPFASLSFSKGQPKLVFLLNLIVLLVKIPVIYIAAKYFGLIGITYGYLLASIIETCVCFYFVTTLVGSILPQFLNNIYKPLSFCLAMVVALLIYQYFLGTIGLVNIIAQVVIGAAVYVGLTLKFKMSLREVMDIKKSL
ncbi:MOP flippase family protein [Mucilaginibacter corticis]|uniref:MOP flippase family protein n=1 Tax=Mucilaginibacter corticis TaxID=2597670 RepID=A0A556MLM6_9SPHI|nr:MOP flippase family protein [Mucilaginibacter corticis]TSJ40752.1 MOP flippase family protein [Mucilaginibacter corticis]